MKMLCLMAAFVFAAAFSVAGAAAHEGGEEGHHLNGSSVDFGKIMEYEIPGFIGKAIGDARINIYDYDLEPLGGIVVERGTVSQAGAEILENPTHRFLIKDAETAQEIFGADSFVKEFNRQRTLNNIRIEAFSFFDQFKLMLGTWIVAMISVFVVPE